MPAFDNGEPSPACILRHKPFLVALGSPFSIVRLAASHQPAALCEDGYDAYSLFFNGLAHYSAKI